MVTFNQLKKNLKKDFDGLKQIKLSILAEDSSQLLVQAIKGYGYDLGYNIEINDCGYNELNLQVFDPNSQLYQFESDFILIIPSSHKLLKKFYSNNLSDKSNFSDNHISYIEELVGTINERTQAKIILCNYIELNDAVFGNFASKVDSSFVFQQRKLNYELMLFVNKQKNVYLNDLLSLQQRFGNSFIEDNKFYINADITFSIDFLPHFAKTTLDVISSLDGKFKKCLILDLDNTLWGGIIGDDGVEGIQIGDLGIGKAFTGLQLWIKQLKERGIILAVCSKNTENIAKEPFISHPDMVLKLDDIAVFVANWENKVDNIKYIQSVLNIGFDSMVFLDDNPFERNIVSENIVGITVPSLPEDPSDYVSYLQYLNLFETSSYSEEDLLRNDLYREETKRLDYKKTFINEGDYLNGLNMTSKVEGFNKFNTPRVAQLTQRSNQFNLRTTRYTEKEIEEIALSDKHICLTFTLDDKFGKNGLIAVIILELRKDSEIFIETWLMSCRILRRGMEAFILNYIVNRAKRINFKKIVGEYIVTTKNGIVENHYLDLGFKKEGDLWILDVNDYKDCITYIKEAE